MPSGKMTGPSASQRVSPRLTYICVCILICICICTPASSTRFDPRPLPPHLISFGSSTCSTSAPGAARLLVPVFMRRLAPGATADSYSAPLQLVSSSYWNACACGRPCTTNVRAGVQGSRSAFGLCFLCVCERACVLCVCGCAYACVLCIHLLLLQDQ